MIKENKVTILIFFCFLSCYMAEAEKMQNILLIINYNFAHYDSIPFLKKIYEPYFPNIIFCGPEKSNGVHQVDIFKGYFGYKSIAYAMQQFPHYDGYLFTNDDCIVNCWNYSRFDKEKIWYHPLHKFRCDKINQESWVWWNTEWGYKALKDALFSLSDKYKERLSLRGKEFVYGCTYSDIVYFPRSYRDSVIELSEHFAQHSVFLEIAIPMICACLEKADDWEYLHGLELWSGERSAEDKKYQKSLDYVHPIKLSSQLLRNFIWSIFVGQRFL